jgi:hypothetical protein
MGHPYGSDYPLPGRQACSRQHHINQVSYCKSSNKDTHVFKAYTFEFSIYALPV